jgi:hypothetical protein
MTGDWITATATIIAAIIGVVGGVFIGRYGKEKRTARFILIPPNDLTRALRSLGDFEVRFGDFSTHELIAGGVRVENTGNVVLDEFRFKLTVPGTHTLALAQPVSRDASLTSGINVSSIDQFPATDPAFDIAIPFFNPGEVFIINALSDGPATACTVSCRLPAVTIEVVTREEILTRISRRAFIKGVLYSVLTTGLAVLIPILIVLYKGRQNKIETEPTSKLSKEIQKPPLPLEQNDKK